MNSGAVTRSRIISIVTIFPLFFVFVIYSPRVIYAPLISLLGVIALYELYELFEKAKINSLKKAGIIFGCIISFSFITGEIYFAAFILTVSILLLLTYILTIQTKEFFFIIEQLFSTVFGLLYVSWLVGYLILLRYFPQGNKISFFLYFVTWSRDVGAFCIGSLFKGHKISPKISPNKTFEGTIGGVVACVLAVIFIKQVLLNDLSYYDCIYLGILLGIGGQIGDLCESVFKRAANVKDSGSLIPGQGGILDTFDSFIFTAPMLYYYLKFVYF